MRPRTHSPLSWILTAGAIAVLASGSVRGEDEEEAALTSPGQKYNYIVGYQVAVSVAQRMSGQGIPLDLEAFQIGMKDAIDGTEPRLTQEEVLAAIQSLQAERATEKSSEAVTNLEAGRAFLRDNSAKDGVVVLASGLQYTEIEAGEGARPKAGATVLVHYRGTLINGEEFDSSIERGEPAKFAVDQVIPGFREALSSMREGAKWRIFVPSELAYGEQGAGEAIGPNQTLIFELELIEVVGE